MADRIWTESQSSAIKTRDRTLLVSAAAGSGKTATLTERIIASILDERDPINIEDMLIVTYTRAAVGELSDRIGKAIKKAIKERPGDARLERQLHMLPSAKISTIDSFCTEILRANAERVGVNPAFRIPDQAEAQLLGEKLLDSLLEAVYDGEMPDIASAEEIDALTDCLAQTKRQGELPSIINLIYTNTLHSLEGVESIGMLVDEFDPEKFTAVEATGYGKYCMLRLSELVTHYTGAFRSFRAVLDDMNDPKHARVSGMVDDALVLLTRLADCSTYTAVHELLSGYEFKNAAPVLASYNLPPIGVIRQGLKADIQQIYEKFFSYTDEDWRIAYTGLHRMLGILYRVVKEYDRLFKQEKLNRGICEFTDIERYTYECLWQDGERTDIALAQAKIYRAVYIDEYQDVNSLQNKIFEAVSSDTNRFMVGDIKQSIYEFRSADPQIFADMKRSFPPLGSEGDFPRASIFMSDNFRCDKGIINFVNDIFDGVFSHIGDSIGYVEADRLNFSKKYDGEMPEYRYPEVCLVTPFKKNDPRNSLIEDKSMIIPDIVAIKIKELLDGGRLDNGDKIEPKHIAIIMRNVKGKAQKYSHALAKYGIPSVYRENERFFINSDVLLVLSLLNAIDNPRRDVYLAGLMCSPLFSFGLGDVGVIKKKAPAETLYDSLRLYVSEGHDTDGRAEKFLTRLAQYRLLSEGMPTDRLLMRLYRETGLLALVAKRKESKDNLMLLYEHARKFESGSFKGLYNFISYINQLTGRQSDFDRREAPDECDAVRIITAHGSKGLEYPIVFFAGADSSFNKSTGIGEAPRFEYEEGFGMGMLLRTPSGLALVANPTKDIVKDYRARRRLEEEARVLYVILTRARERLYIVGATPTDREGFLAVSDASREYMSSYSIYGTPSFLRMILDMKEQDILGPCEFLADPPYVFTDEAMLDAVLAEDTPRSEEEIQPAVHTDTQGTAELAAELERRFTFIYPREHMTRLPGKLSVSKLYPAILDGTDDSVTEAAAEESPAEQKRGVLPSFRSGEDADISAKKGIATHMLLQFCDLGLLMEHGATRELTRLTEKGFLSKRDAELVRVREIEKFVRSRLITDMLGAMKLYREFRFNVKLPAERFTEDPCLREKYKGEYALVQGVIDCLWVDENGDYHLIDYKTDRLTREELADRSLARAKMYEKHSLQLSYYADAVELMFGKRPATVEVYSLPLGDTLDVKVK